MKRVIARIVYVVLKSLGIGIMAAGIPIATVGLLRELISHATQSIIIVIAVVVIFGIGFGLNAAYTWAKANK